MYLKNKISIILGIFLLLLCFTGYKLIGLYIEKNLSYSNIKNLRINFEINKLDKIAHAAGGYKKEIYTNSIEALNHNKNKFNLLK